MSPAAAALGLASLLSVVAVLADASRWPEDYTRLETGYYKVHTERATWAAACSACRAEGAHLSVISTDAEAAALRELLARTNNVSNELHAGFYLPDIFVTVFGAPLSYVGYQRWAPEQEHAQTCGTVNHNLLMYDAKCTDKRSFICRFVEGASEKVYHQVTQHAERPRPANTYRNENFMPSYKGLMQQGRMHYYRVNEEKMRWSRAKAACEKEGAHLLILNHQMEADVLREHIRGFKGLSDQLHVGLVQEKQRPPGYTFLTIFGSRLGYERWESEQPEDETCLAIDHNMLLKKSDCWEKRSFICETVFA